MQSSPLQTIIIAGLIFVSILFYLLARNLLTKLTYKETYFQIWYAAAIGILTMSGWIVFLRMNSLLPRITLLLLSLRFTMLFIQRCIVVVLTPRIRNLSPTYAEEWFNRTSENPTVYNRLYLIAAYLTISIFLEFAAWLVALSYRFLHLNTTSWLALIIYILVSIAAIFILSYQPWRGNGSPKLLREAFISAVYDFPLSLIVMATFLAYSNTNERMALFLVVVGYTLSKFIRYYGTGQGLRQELYHSNMLFCLQPVASLIITIGFLYLL